MKKAVFMDRDGVINHPVVRNGRPYPPASLDEFEIIPEAFGALESLVKAGYLLIGITNQPDVARGSQTREMIESINSIILTMLPIQEIFTCYHDDQDHCLCRKPKPGLILQAAEKYNIDLGKSWMVGDRWKDVSAGEQAGLRTVFVNYHYSETYIGHSPDFTIHDMAFLAETILNS